LGGGLSGSKGPAEESPTTIDASQWPESYVRNCLLVPRENDDIFFVPDELATKKHVLAMLDGYAIIPMEEYRSLTTAEVSPERIDRVQA
jgi:hypothetical protein